MKIIFNEIIQKILILCSTGDQQRKKKKEIKTKRKKTAREKKLETLTGPSLA